MEAVNIKGDEKIFLMVALVSFLYTLCVIQGLKIAKMARKSKKSDSKRFKDGTITLAKSYFKRGKEELKKFLFTIFNFVTFINKLLEVAKPPINLFVQ